LDHVYAAFEKVQCRGCHVDDGVASASRLHFPALDATREQIEAFGLTLNALVDRDDPSKSLLLTKPTNRIAHTGGERIAPGSAEESDLATWVRHLSRLPEEAVAAARDRLADDAASSRQAALVRRLTHSQYNNTVRDLLGEYGRVADRFPPEDFVNGFKNQVRTQGVPPLLAEAYSNAAERLARNAFRVGDVNNIVPCEPASSRDAECRDKFIREFGLRTFRRPMTSAEQQRYASLFNEQAQTSGEFLDGARIVVEAMLQSPNFLFHVEGGPGDRFPDYAIASRLSYLLWDTMPDDTLLESAARGELQTQEGLDRATRRMLDDPRAREAMTEFFSQWLRFDRVYSTVKDGRRYPEFTPELAATMVEETQRLLDHLVWNDRNFMEIFTADYGFLNAELAGIYGLPNPPGEFQMMRFPENANRAGLLGQGAFLVSTGKPGETSPTVRGVFIREQLLCQHVPNPPPGVNTTLPEPRQDLPLTTRQRLASHVENRSCASCHQLMDPIGFGLENYDTIGRWREKEVLQFRTSRRETKTIPLDIDATGRIAGIEGSDFAGTKQLGQVLSESETCQECVVKQLFRYAFGRLETQADDATIEHSYVTFRDSGFRFQQLLLALVKSPEFLDGVKGVEANARAANLRP
jgi:hypothetical protein